VASSVTVSAANEGDYTYEVSSGSATITGYSGTDGSITIPATMGGYATVRIGDAAFYENTNLSSVNIPNGVTTIGNNSFYSGSGAKL
jgi:hypothetical protein